MRAARLPEFGIEHLVVDELDDPVPAAGEVLIAAEAATINPADAGVVSGALAGGFPPDFTPPYTPGWDVAGRVVALGADVDSALLGSRVVGFSPWFTAAHGMQASRVALPVANVAVAPDGLTSASLTTLGLNGLTAWRAIDEANLEPGETIVVTGAAGSVGGFALQLAVSRGIRVIAAVSAHDGDAVLALGASAVAAREDGDLADVVRGLVSGGVDALIDTASIGTPTLGAIRDGGRFVTGTVPAEATRGITASRIYGTADSDALSVLVDMATAGTLSTPVAKTFDIADVRAAYTEFGARPHRGRIVLTF